jgi:hypothetical protein
MAVLLRIGLQVLREDSQLGLCRLGWFLRLLEAFIVVGFHWRTIEQFLLEGWVDLLLGVKLHVEWLEHPSIRYILWI